MELAVALFQRGYALVQCATDNKLQPCFREGRADACVAAAIHEGATSGGMHVPHIRANVARGTFAVSLFSRLIAPLDCLLRLTSASARLQVLGAWRERVAGHCCGKMRVVGPKGERG